MIGTGRTAAPQWALAAGQRVQRQLAGLQDARSAARQVASFAPRRWPERSRVRRAGDQTAALPLVAATVLSLAHASTVAGQPHSAAVREALSELTSAFAALAEGCDAPAAVRHASRARVLVTASDCQLMARLVEACADDTLRLAGHE